MLQFDSFKDSQNEKQEKSSEIKKKAYRKRKPVVDIVIPAESLSLDSIEQKFEKLCDDPSTQNYSAQQIQVILQIISCNKIEKSVGLIIAHAKFKHLLYKPNRIQILRIVELFK